MHDQHLAAVLSCFKDDQYNGVVARMSSPCYLHLAPEALTRRVPRLLEMDEQITSHAYSDTTYHLEAGPCFDMGGVEGSEAGVSAIVIEARLEDGHVVGRLEAYIFDMEKLSDLGLMRVFEHSANTRELFNLVYLGNPRDSAEEYSFQPGFVSTLRANLPAESLQYAEQSFALEDYCMGYHIAHLESFWLEDDFRDQGISWEMMSMLLGLSDYFDIMIEERSLFKTIVINKLQSVTKQ